MKYPNPLRLSEYFMCVYKMNLQQDLIKIIYDLIRYGEDKRDCFLFNSVIYV